MTSYWALPVIQLTDLIHIVDIVFKLKIYACSSQSNSQKVKAESYNKCEMNVAGWKECQIIHFQVKILGIGYLVLRKITGYWI